MSNWPPRPNRCSARAGRSHAATPVREVLGVVLNEEWWHRQFAERDLAVLDPAPNAAT